MIPNHEEHFKKAFKEEFYKKVHTCIVEILPHYDFGYAFKQDWTAKVRIYAIGKPLEILLLVYDVSEESDEVIRTEARAAARRCRDFIKEAITNEFVQKYKSDWESLSGKDGEGN